MTTVGPGTSLGRYIVEAPLGEGGMGEVFRATDTVLGRAVALKILSQDRLIEIDAEERAVFEARFQREARAAAATKHPNAVVLYDYGTLDGVLFIAMELVEGEPLRASFGSAAVPLATRVRWLHELAGALAAIHGAGLIHRDIKPGNLMITREGTLKVLDFGIARRITNRDAQAPGEAIGAPKSFRTVTGQVIGTPRWMAPEQLAGTSIDARVDQYAWGLVAYELLGGASASAVGRDAPTRRSLGDVVPGLPPELSKVIERTLEADPARRFPTMSDVANPLVPFLHAAPRLAGSTTATPLGPPANAPTLYAPLAAPRSPAPTPARDRGLLWGILGGGALIAVSAMAGGTYLLTRAPAASPGTTALPSTLSTTPPGEFCWVDLGTSDPAAATTFYAQLFGWTVASGVFGPTSMYSAFKSKEATVAGIYKQMAPGVPPLWTSYVAVTSADATLAQATSAGGTTVVPAFDVAGLGRAAGVKDATGAFVGVLQPASVSLARATPVACKSGAPCWNELRTAPGSAPRATAFYAATFGWSSSAPSSGYVFFSHDGRRVAGAVAVPKTAASAWSVYFAVDDCDLAVRHATTLGGAVVVPATDIAGVGRYAVLRDPQGAVFAVLRPTK